MSTNVNSGEVKNVANFLASKDGGDKAALTGNNVGQDALHTCAAQGMGDRTTYMAATQLNNASDLIAKHLGSACTNFALDHHGGAAAEEPGHKADAALQTAQAVNGLAEAGNFSGGAEGALSAHMGDLSGVKPSEYFAKGFVQAALANYQQRKAVRGEATAMGMPADMASKFPTKEAFDNYLKSQKKGQAA
jgi:hypothetical protein